MNGALKETGWKPSDRKGMNALTESILCFESIPFTLEQAFGPFNKK